MNKPCEMRHLILLFIGLCFAPNSRASTSVQGTISSNTTWALSNSPYIVTGDVTVNNGVTLTIEPGVVMKFDAATNNWGGFRRLMTVNGILHAVGSSGSPIVFTSSRDDAYGGDSNGDGTATTPDAKNWGYVQINSSGSQIQYCIFRYGGTSYYDANYSPPHDSNPYMLWINGPHPAVDVTNCTFQFSYQTALYYVAGSYATQPNLSNNVFESCPIGLSVAGNGSTQVTIQGNSITGSSTQAIYVSNVLSNSVISGNTIQNCLVGIASSNSSPVIQNNTLTGTAGNYAFLQDGAAQPSYSGNTINGYRAIQVSGTVGANTTWKNLGLPYVITGDVTVNNGVTLTIEPGVVVKFDAATNNWGGFRRLMTVNGILHAVGSSGSPIVFTSSRDDAYGGDSNGDGTATTPDAKNWGYVQINSSGSQIQYCIFRYGGTSYYDANYSPPHDSNPYMLWINGPHPAVDVTNCTFQFSYQTALYYVAGSYATQPNLSNNVFESCPIGLSVAGNGSTQVTIQGNSITGSSTQAIYVSNVLSNSVISGNTIQNCLVGIASSNSSPVIQNNTLTGTAGNYAFLQDGAAQPSYSGNTINGYRAIQVSGTVGANTTWKNLGLPYVITGDVTVNNGVTLTIEPGVVVKFDAATNNWGGFRRLMTVNGILHAVGSSGSPIVFTSSRDDAYGGDSNGDGTATTPDAKNWGYVQINSSGSQIQYCIFRYGGTSYYDANYSPPHDSNPYMLWINGPHPAVDVTNCTFQFSYQTALYYVAGSYATQPNLSNNVFESCPIGLSVAGNGSTQVTIQGNSITGSSTQAIYVSNVLSNSVISGNTIQNCLVGIASSNSSPVIQNNTLTGTAGNYAFLQDGAAQPSYSGNTINGYRAIQVSGTVGANTTWKNLGLPYVITGDVTVNNGVTLTIEPGVVVKFDAATNNWGGFRRLMTVNGILHAVGSSGSPIVFTSSRDDAYGGDSNGDGTATTPDAKNWGYVQINSSGSQIQYCIFRYGGTSYYDANYSPPHDSNPYMLWITRSGVNISRCVFNYCYSNAVFIDIGTVNDLTTIITACAFDSCPTGVRYDAGTASNINGILFGNTFKNGQTGIRIVSAGDSLQIQQNLFDNISGYGINNSDSTIIVQAQNNWWGDASGPSGTGSGHGVPVSQYVTYSNWWTTPNQSTFGVQNVIAQRRDNQGMIVDIFYDLNADAGKTYNVKVEVSNSGGEPYMISPSSDSLSGAVGSGVHAGTGLHIVWDGSKGNTSNYTGLMRVKVIADVE